MAQKKEVQKVDISTEERIKEAARTVFYKKGFAATRTRDIAEEAGINLALLNYYYRSKQKLFDLIMTETMSRFIQGIQTVLNNEKTTLEQKVNEIVCRYIDLILEEPEIPTFLLTELRSNKPKELLAKLPLKQTVLDSVFYKQHQSEVELGKIKEPNPIHFLMNMMGLIVFPFIAKPLLMEMNNLEAKDFNLLMQDRKKLIPVLVKAMMGAE